MLTLPREAETLLKLLNDHAVGGNTVTPGLREYSAKHTFRTALETRQDWADCEGVHLNPSRESQASALKSMGLLDSSKCFEDRVVLLDFDIYAKDGSPKAASITPDEILSRLKTEGLPLPYYWLESGTEGNFHMVWVLKDPVDRDEARPLVKSIYSYWGADTNYTNSTMRNPVYLSVHHPEKIHWWQGWTDSPPLLEDMSLLLPEGEVHWGQSSKGAAAATSAPGKFKSRMTLKELEEAMLTAQDGDGRWKLLTSWVRRQVMVHLNSYDRPMSASEIRDCVAQGNSILSTPLEARRAALIEVYWTPSRQRIYVARQKKAGRNNTSGQVAHLKAKTQYFKTLALRDQLHEFLAGNPHSLPTHTLSRDASFEGRKLSPRGDICYPYLAWMLGIEDKEDDDGKVTTGAAQVKNLLGNGRRAGYDSEEHIDPETGEVFGYAPYHEFSPEELQKVDEILSVLTRDDGCSRVSFAEPYIPPPKQHKKEVIYAC